MNAAQLAGGSGIAPKGLLATGTWALCPTGGAAGGIANAAALATVVLGAPVSANVLTTILSTSGRGAVQYLGVQNFDTGSRTQRLKVTMDGVVIFDLTSAAATDTTQIYPCIGSLVFTGSTVPIFTFEPLTFESSLLIEYTSSTTGNSARVAYRVTPR